MSMIGRPNMDDQLADDEFEDASRPRDESDEVEEGEEQDGDFDSDWGDFTVKMSGKQMDDCFKKGGEQSNSGEPVQGLFVPEPVVSLLNESKPAMPLLPQDQLPPGCDVWVVDEEDVKMLLKENWDVSLKIVCNGRECGKVVRHTSHDLTLVAFESGSLGMKYSFTLPRVCLSLKCIEAYESSPKMTGLKGAAALGFGGVGNLGPRAGRGTAKEKEEVNVFQQHYEVMSVNGIKCPSADPAWELLKRGKGDLALKSIEQAISDDIVGEHRKEHFCIRSTINLFLGNYVAALADALKVIEINPSWVKGYLRAARAYKAHGKFTLASHMINQSLLLLPHSHEVSSVSAMNDFLRKQQQELEANFALNLRLDAQYAKRLFPKRGFQPGESLFDESDFIMCIPAMTNTAECCQVCLNSEGVSEMPTPTAKPSTMLYCSAACQQKSSLFLPMEIDFHAIGNKSALSLIYSKAANSMNMLPLEQARLAIRLFLVVCTTHERLRAQTWEAQDQSEPEEDVSVEHTLRHLGIYPLVSSDLDGKTREELTVLCNVLCQHFTDTQKSTYPPLLFVQLYSFVVSYVVFGEYPSPKGVVKGYLLGRLCGGVDRSKTGVNCEIRCFPGRLSIIATSEITKDAKLVISPIQSHH